MKSLIILPTILALGIKTTIANPDFEVCVEANQAKKCAPFETVRSYSELPPGILSQTFTGLGDCTAPTNTMEYVNKLWFNMYKGGELIGVIPGTSFWLKPKEFFDDSCYIILMEGYMSHGKRAAADVAKSNDWTTHCANKLHRHANENGRNDCTVIVVNWGLLSCKNYICLVARVIKPLGEKLGELFADRFDPQHLYLIGHSLGAHILGYACGEVIRRGKKCSKLVALDMAGPFFNSISSWLPNVIHPGVYPDVANRTVAIYTNPGFLGTRELSRAHVNILVNSPDYKQPGCENVFNKVANYIFPKFFTNLLDSVIVPAHVCNHVFPLMLIGSMCDNTECLVFDDKNKQVNLNVMYNHDIPAGTYHLTIKTCYPFCCHSKLDFEIKAKL